MLQFMATEHSVLQAGRSATIFETGGRITVFLGTVASALIALAFVGQISGLGTAFFALALVLLPTPFCLDLQIGIRAPRPDRSSAHPEVEAVKLTAD